MGRTVFAFDAIGTGWRVTTDEPLTGALRRDVLSLCEDVDRVWSRFRADSLVAEIARADAGGGFRIPERDMALLDLYDRLFHATGGAVDPLVGRDLELLGYDAGYSLVPDRDGLASRTPDDWSRDVRRTGDGNMLVTERPVVIDVGAAGKGHLVDLVADLLRHAGVENALVDGGGDVRHVGSEPVVAGLEHPTRPGRVIGTVALQDAALCASAVNRRTWGEGLHHILDGRTGTPVTDVVGTWVVAADAATADGLATSLFLADPGRLGGFDAAWVRMLADGRVQWSDNFTGELFI